MNEVLIYGEIGWEVTASGVIEQLKNAAGEDVKVRISSGGGDVYEGIAIVNALRGYEGAITVVIESLAASAASFIAAGCGARVVARPNAEVMVHRAWTMQMGNSNDLAKTIGDLERQDAKLAAIYSDKTGGSAEEWLERMDAETWFTAQEAFDAGLVDAIEDAKAVAPVAKTEKSRVLASCRYASRSAAPPPPIASNQEVKNTEPSDGQNGDKMSILNQLAQELGRKPEEVQNALSGFFNEVVPISGEVNVTYPSDVKIIPTQTIKIEPIVGDKPTEDADGSVEVVPEGEAPAEPAGDSAAVQLAKSAGLTFAMGDVAEGWTAEVDEGGIVTVKAPSGAEVGSAADFTVLVNETSVALTVTVRAFDEEPDGEKPATEPAADPAPKEEVAAKHTPLTAMVDSARLAELEADAAYGREARSREVKATARKLVEEAVQDGRIGAASRERWVAQLLSDPEDAKERLSQIRKGQVHRAETGHALNSVSTNDDDQAMNGMIAQFH